MLTRPFLWSAVWLCAGLLLPPPIVPWSCWALCGATALAGSIALCLIARNATTERAASFALAIGFLAAGRTAGLVGSMEEPRDLASLLRHHPEAFGRGVVLSGRLAAPPAPGPYGTELLVDARHVRIGRIRHRVRGRVQLRVAPGPDDASPEIAAARGDTMKIFTRLFLPHRFGNEGAFDYARHLKARGIDVLGSVKSARLIKREFGRPAGFTRATMRNIDELRATILSRIQRAFANQRNASRAAPICAALLLGERSEIAARDETRLAEAGLSHLLAVSGFNVAVLAMLLLLLARMAGASRRLAALIIIPALILYLLLNRDESSVVRAVIMAVTIFGGSLLWRRSNPGNTLGLSAIIILAGCPAQIDDAGFQLTFAATIALIMLAPLLIASRGSKQGASRYRTVRWLRAALVVSLVAALGTFPLTIIHFNRVTPGSIPANILAGPLMAAAFVGAGVIAAASPLSERVTRVTAWMTANLIETTFLIADAVCAIPWMTYRRITPGPALVLLYYGALLWFFATRAGTAWGRWRRRVQVSTLSISVLFLLLPLDERSHPQGLRLTAIDVGQGDAILVETSGGTRLLIDAGGAARGDFDMGERVVAPALWNLGISRIDYLVVTHPDADHSGGAAAVAAAFRPSQIWVPAGATEWMPRRAINRLRATARESGIPVMELAAGDTRCLRDACVKVLHPPRDPTPATAINERSLVLSISSRGRQALLAADAGASTEALLGNVLTRADYLKVGHHGSRTSSTAGFLDRLRPRIAIISCGARNRFGHPDESVLARLGRFHARVCRTDRHGAVTVELIGRPSQATLVDSTCLFDRQGAASHVSAEERAGDEAEDQDDQGPKRHENTPRRKTP